MLTIAKLSRWSINYYNDTAKAAGQAAADAQKAGGGLGEYYTEHDTRTPVWLCAGDTRTAAKFVGLTDIQRAGGEADTEVVARWLDDGVAPNGACGRAFGTRGVHGFDLTFCAPKSVSLIRALRADEVADKAVAAAHATAIDEAMEHLAQHAGYTRVHNPVTGEKDLVRLPGLMAIAYQHETSRAGDPHLHTHVIVPNRQARHDGQLVSIDGTSLYHDARAAGVIYQATLRRELHRLLGVEWTAAGPATGMAEVAGITRETITAWSQRLTPVVCQSARAAGRDAFDCPAVRSEVVCGLNVEDPCEHRDQPSEVGVGSRSVACGCNSVRSVFSQSSPAPRSERRRSKNSRVERPLPSRKGWAKFA